MQNNFYTTLVPKVNPDIDFSYRDNEYIITLNESNFHLKVSSKLFDLLKLVDNQKNLVLIVNEYNEKYFQSQIDNKLAYELLYNKLGHYNIIESYGEIFTPDKKPSYLKLNITIINTKTAKLLSKPFLFLFSNIILGLLISICLAILSITFITNYNDIFVNLKSISSSYFGLYTCLMIVSSLFHELGHTAATHKFGGKHTGIGIGFYLFTPVIYADVSSSWKFNSNQRIIVNLAGIYFELLLGTTLIVISLIIKMKALLIIPSIILFKTLFNLNPFLRTDGYWVLSDLIKVPNLRKKSNGVLKSFLLKRDVKSIKIKDFFLMFYAFIANVIIFIFLIYIFIANQKTLLSFPCNIYLFFKSIISNKFEFTNNITDLIIPLFFYILLLQLIINYSGKVKNRIIAKR